MNELMAKGEKRHGVTSQRPELNLNSDPLCAQTLPRHVGVW